MQYPNSVSGSSTTSPARHSAFSHDDVILRHQPHPSSNGFGGRPLSWNPAYKSTYNRQSVSGSASQLGEYYTVQGSNAEFYGPRQTTSVASLEVTPLPDGGSGDGTKRRSDPANWQLKRSSEMGRYQQMEKAWRQHKRDHFDEVQGSARELLDEDGEMEEKKVPFRPLTAVFRILAIIFIIGDAILDWLYLFRLKKPLECYPEKDSSLQSFQEMCFYPGRETYRRVLAAFVLLGTAFAALQVANIALETCRDLRLINFRPVHAMLELHVIIFLDELPQAITFVLFTRTCTCPVASPEVNWTLVLAVTSVGCGLLAALLRFATGYREFCGREGCCNTWWRCCCCRDPGYFLQATFQSCCCDCEIPVSPLCCTLSCQSDKRQVLCWCPWRKNAVASIYSIRLMVILGLLGQVACIVLLAIKFSPIVNVA